MGVDRDEKQHVVAELTERLRATEALIVADYRGLTMPQIDSLRGRLLEQGARFTVVKNTLSRRAAKDAGVEALLAMLEGPTAIAFVQSEGSMVEVARALADSARETRVLVIRGGLMQGRTITAADVDELSRLPPFDVLRGQVLGAITAPLTNLLALVSAPLQNLVGLIDARIEQLGGAAPEAAPAAGVEPTPAPDAGEAGEADQPGASAPGDTDDGAGEEAASAATEAGPAAEADVAAGGENESPTDSDDQEVHDGGS